jgi:AcrR family transcriptional regulator
MPGGLKSRLQQIALELVREVGPRAFTMAELSRRAGVSAAAPYKHFADKDEVVLSLVVRSVRAQRDRYVRAMASATGPEEKLVAFAKAVVRFSYEEPGLFELTLMAGRSKDRSPDLVRYTGEIRAALADAARYYISDDARRYDLLMRLAGAAHGIAIFHEEGLFPEDRASVEDAEGQVAVAARAILAAVGVDSSIET